MPDSHHQHNQPIVLDLINDTVVSHADPIQVFYSRELLDAPWSRVNRQSVHGADESDLILSGKLEEFLSRGRP